MLDYIRNRVFTGTDEVINNMGRIETAYNNVIKLAKISRKEGILALEFNAGFVKDTRNLADDLSWMIHLIVEGTEPVVMEEFLTNRFLANNYKSIDAFVYYLYARGSMYIQEGNSPYQIEEFFNSVLPSSVHRQQTGGFYFGKEYYKYTEDNRGKLAAIREEMSEETRKEVDNVKTLMLSMTKDEWNHMTDCDGVAGWEWIVPAVDENCRIMIDAYMNMGRILGYLWNIRMPKGNEILEACKDFEAKLINYRCKHKKQGRSNEPAFLLELIAEEEFVIQEILNKVDDGTLALALKGCDTPMRNEIFKYIGKKRKYEIEDDMDYMGPVRLSDAEAALSVLKSIYLKTKES